MACIRLRSVALTSNRLMYCNSLIISQHLSARIYKDISVFIGDKASLMVHQSRIFLRKAFKPEVNWLEKCWVLLWFRFKLWPVRSSVKKSEGCGISKWSTKRRWGKWKWTLMLWNKCDAKISKVMLLRSIFSHIFRRS